MSLTIHLYLTPYSIVATLSGVLSILLAIYVYSKKLRFSGMTIIKWIALLTALHSFTFAFKLSSSTLQEYMLWTIIQSLSTPFLAPLMLLLVLHFTGSGMLCSRKSWLLFVIPATSVILVLTNNDHHLFFKSLELRSNHPSYLFDAAPGTWYYIHGGYSIAMLLASLFSILKYWRTARPAHHKQMLMLITGLALPLLSILAFLPELTLAEFDLSLVLLGAALLLYLIAIGTAGMLVINPVEWESIYESMHVGVIVLNISGQIVYFNHTASQILSNLTQLAIGKRFDDIWKQNEELESTRINLDSPVDQKFKRIHAGDTFHYRLRVSPLLMPSGRLTGSTLVITDLTEQTLLQDKLRQLAETDGLTAIYNRTVFMDKSRALLTKCRKNQRPFSFILFDIDYFKQINDQYGHRTGDFALQHTVNICKQALPEEALFGRYGGEEFAICLPDVTLKEAGETAERIRREIALTPLYSSAKAISITASFGVAEAHSSNMTLEVLLNEADMALYQSKHAGRNMVRLQKSHPDMNK